MTSLKRRACREVFVVKSKWLPDIGIGNQKSEILCF